MAKAVSEEGVRVNIRRSDLTEWRTKFAAEPRAVGIPANATSAAMRELERMNPPDGLYRAAARGGSILLQNRLEAALSRPRVPPDVGPRGYTSTAHNEFELSWRPVARTLAKQDETALADEIDRWLAVKRPERSIDVDAYTAN